jgi:hypothetical protein
MMVRVPQLVAFKIYESYPDKVAIIPVHDDETDMWNSALYKIEVEPDGTEYYSETLFELGHYRNKTKEDAVNEMIKTLDEAMRVVKITCN